MIEVPKAIEHDGIWIKQCSRCKEFKKVEEFYRNEQYGDGLHNWCKECVRGNRKRWYANNRERSREISRRWQVNNPERRWVINTLSSHRQKDFEVNITIDALTELAKNTKTCLLCGCELDWSVNTKGYLQFNSPSLDRIDNADTLTLDNVQIICYRCNVTKQNRSMKEFVEYCKLVADSCSYLMEVND